MPSLAYAGNVLMADQTTRCCQVKEKHFSSICSYKSECNIWNLFFSKVKLCFIMQITLIDIKDQLVLFTYKYVLFMT